MSTTAPTPAAVAADESPVSTMDAILWWEYRRILFNLALLAVGVVSVIVMIAIFSQAIDRGVGMPPPQAIVLGIGAYAVAANMFYTLGWVVELIVRRDDPVVARKSARVMFKLGLIGSCVLTTAPIWLALLFVVLGMIFRQR